MQPRRERPRQEQADRRRTRRRTAEPSAVYATRASNRSGPMMPLASARSAQAGGTGASQNPRRGGSLMVARTIEGRAKPVPLGRGSLDIVGESDHQSVLDVVEGLHPILDGDVGGAARCQLMILGPDEGGHPQAQVRGDRRLIGQVEHLELVEQVVDLADLVPAGMPGSDLGRPVVLELLDARAGLLDHFACTTMKIDVLGGRGAGSVPPGMLAPPPRTSSIDKGAGM